MSESPQEVELKRPEPDCAYCSAATASKQLGMSGEHSLKGVNKGSVDGGETNRQFAVMGKL